MDNVDKYNKNKSSIVSSSGLGGPVLIPRTKNAVFLWVFVLLVAGLLCTAILYVMLPLSGSAGNINSAVLLSSESKGYSTALGRDVELLKGQMNVLITGAIRHVRSCCLQVVKFHYLLIRIFNRSMLR